MIASQGIDATHRLIESEPFCEKEKRVNNVAHFQTHLSSSQIMKMTSIGYSALTRYALFAALGLIVLSSLGSCNKNGTNTARKTEGTLWSLQPNEISFFEWSMDGHDAKHTRLSSYNGPTSSSMLWNVRLTEPILLSGIMGEPAISDGMAIYVLRADGTLFALNRNGIFLWRLSLGQMATTSLAVGRKGVIYASAISKIPLTTQIPQATLYAITPNGELKWSVPIGEGLMPLSPTISDKGVIYTGIFQGDLVAVSSSGKRIWKKSIGGGISDPPAISDDGELIVGTMDNSVKALDTDGKELWSYKLDDRAVGSPVIGPDGTIYVCSGRLLALTAEGKIKWSFEEGSDLKHLALCKDGSLVIRDDKERIFRVSAEGKTIWKLKLDTNDLGAPCVDANGTVYVPTGYIADKGALFAVSSEGKLLWKADIGTTYISAPSPVIGDNGRLYVGDEDGVLWAFGEKEAWEK